MHSLEPLEQLAVEAFVTALETCREEGVELPEKVWAIAQSPEQYITELSKTAKQYPQLNAAYQTARKLLRKAEGDRNKRMSTDNHSLLKQSDPFSKQSFNSPFSSREIKPTPHSTSDDSSKAFATSTLSPTQPIVYRYTLPDTASPQAVIIFSKQVEAIRQSNPDWVVSHDRRNPGEADAIILIHKDEQYATTHAAYLMNQTLNQIVAPALVQIFGTTPAKLSEPS